ncbi:molecular chaperone TorD [Shewanella marisflavi]|uniref:Chaperone protein TorD n=1 Tax=Shewanella marisflavi TaxID=260364 RepID=A0AAC9TW46_9GAMM|nr:molecular chaperone TorD [Shewanella marisflavi]ASJ96060.1 molecular chaperone TorD [Shewanella marisflavi]
MHSTNRHDTPQNQARGKVYALLSDLFAREIDSQSLQRLTSPEAQAFFDLLAADPQLAPSIGQLRQKLSSLNSERELLELAADYCSLFLVGGKLSANPYASLYLSQAEQANTLLFGEQHQSMLETLAQSQLQLHKDFPEPADHIAVILAYVAHQACQRDDASQLAFIAPNLNAWLASFADQVAKVDKGTFYGALAQLTKLWVQADCEALCEHSSKNQ